MRFLLSIFVILVFSSGLLFSQTDLSSRYTFPVFDTTSQDDLLFRLESNVFFKNNEYFSNYTEGYTLPGFMLQPTLMYYAGKHLRFKIGAHLTQFYGSESLFDVQPVISAQFRASDRTTIILGALRGNVHHNLIEPVLDPESQYFRPVENGVQLLFKSSRLNVDMWIDWEQFISWGDTVPERFTAGISGNLMLTNGNSSIDINIPFHVVAEHQSGQISDYTDPDYSMANMVVGLDAGVYSEGDFVKKVWMKGYYVGFSQFAGTLDLGFESGHAFYPNVGIDYKYGQFMLGYWYADDFYSLKGNPEFMSLSDFQEGFYSKYRKMGVVKITFFRIFSDENVKLNACLNGYYDFPANQFDYSYGLSLIYTPNFRIAKLKSW
ncbi:MAG: hypothetical protein GXO47_05085 [Chlorobi bacterium]|nr:hypothetical protein [Chlorobiota bacterium]